MYIAIVVAVLLIAAVIFEYRLRRPDQLVLYESDGTVRLRRGRFYPRHFSLALTGTVHPLELKVDGIARGGLPIRTALAASVAPSPERITALIRVGGWQRDAVTRAARELETVIQASVRHFTEQRAIEDLCSEALSRHLSEEIGAAAESFGLELVSLTVQSIDPVDATIAEAMRRRESARILEQTELLNQQARVSAARAKLEADEQIARSEHELALKSLELKQVELEKEALLAQKRTEEEIKRNRMRLAYEKEEMALLKSNPELLLLSPQAARLAEASQSLRNARTVISLGAAEAEGQPNLPNMFRRFLELLLEAGKEQPKAGNRGGI